jgi:predicted ester cyclase
MSVEENKAVVRQFSKRMANGDRSAVDELTTDSFVMHNLATGAEDDRAALKQGNARILSAFSGISLIIKDLVAEDDRVVVRYTFGGTHTGKFMKISPTGKRFTVARFMVFRLANSKIAEGWNLIDHLSMFQQLGVLPPTQNIGK